MITNPSILVPSINICIYINRQSFLNVSYVTLLYTNTVCLTYNLLLRIFLLKSEHIFEYLLIVLRVVMAYTINY